MIVQPRCPRCGERKLRMKINVFIDASDTCRSLDKSAIRQSDIKVEGADWDNGRQYCPRCGWAQSPAKKE